MARFYVDVSDEDQELLQDFLVQVNTGDVEFTSHGRLTISRLAGMLLEDVVLMLRRPSSWEGAHMMTVIRAHGYGDTFTPKKDPV